MKLTAFELVALIFTLFTCVLCGDIENRATLPHFNPPPPILPRRISVQPKSPHAPTVKTIVHGKVVAIPVKVDKKVQELKKRAVNHVKVDGTPQSHHLMSKKPQKIPVVSAAASKKRFQNTDPMMVTEYNTQLEFSSTLDGCERTKLGYLSAQIVWPIWKTIAGLVKYVCNQQVLDEAALVLGLYISEVGKDTLKARLKERIGATNAQQHFIIPNIEHRQKLETMLDAITVDKMEYKDKIYFIYNSNVLTFNIRTAHNGEYMATLTEMPRAIIDQIEETFAGWYYSD